MGSMKGKLLSYTETLNLLSSYGIPLARGEIAKSPDEASKIAEQIGFPVVLKVVSPQVVHKTEAGAVKLKLTSSEEVKKAFQEIVENVKRYDSRAEIEGVLVQEMVEDGVETIIGVSRDPQFGPVILFGLGGIFVEVLRDVSLRLPPLTVYDAEEMVREIKGYRLLEGFRGRPKADVKALVELLLKVSRMVVELKDRILEMDLNPVMVRAEGLGAKVVDARIFVVG